MDKQQDCLLKKDRVDSYQRCSQTTQDSRQNINDQLLRNELLKKSIQVKSKMQRAQCQHIQERRRSIKSHRLLPFLVKFQTLLVIITMSLIRPIESKGSPQRPKSPNKSGQNKGRSRSSSRERSRSRSSSPTSRQGRQNSRRRSSSPSGPIPERHLDLPGGSDAGASYQPEGLRGLAQHIQSLIQILSPQDLQTAQAMAMSLDMDVQEYLLMTYPPEQYGAVQQSSGDQGHDQKDQDKKQKEQAPEDDHPRELKDDQDDKPQGGQSQPIPIQDQNGQQEDDYYSDDQLQLAIQLSMIGITGEDVQLHHPVQQSESGAADGGVGGEAGGDASGAGGAEDPGEGTSQSRDPPKGLQQNQIRQILRGWWGKHGSKKQKNKKQNHRDDEHIPSHYRRHWGLTQQQQMQLAIQQSLMSSGAFQGTDHQGQYQQDQNAVQNSLRERWSLDPHAYLQDGLPMAHPEVIDPKELRKKKRQEEQRKKERERERQQEAKQRKKRWKRISSKPRGNKGGERAQGGQQGDKKDDKDRKDDKDKKDDKDRKDKQQDKKGKAKQKGQDADDQSTDTESKNKGRHRKKHRKNWRSGRTFSNGKGFRLNIEGMKELSSDQMYQPRFMEREKQVSLQQRQEQSLYTWHPSEQEQSPQVVQRLSQKPRRGRLTNKQKRQRQQMRNKTRKHKGAGLYSGRKGQRPYRPIWPIDTPAASYTPRLLREGLTVYSKGGLQSPKRHDKPQIFLWQVKQGQQTSDQQAQKSKKQAQTSDQQAQTSDQQTQTSGSDKERNQMKDKIRRRIKRQKNKRDKRARDRKIRRLCRFDPQLAKQLEGKTDQQKQSYLGNYLSANGMKQDPSDQYYSTEGEND